MKRTTIIKLLLLSSAFLFYACENVTNSVSESPDNIQITQMHSTPQVHTMSAEKPIKTPSGTKSITLQYAKPGTEAPTTIFRSLEPGATNSFASLAYQANGFFETGDYIQTSQLGVLHSVIVGMSSWACETGGWSTDDCFTSEGATFDHPVTINIYEIDNSGSAPAVGSLITSKTQTFSIPYRPSADDELCEDGRFYDDRVELCFNGLNNEITFDFSGDSMILPQEFIYGIEYNTETYGDNPVGTPGPYNSLNFALIDKRDYPVFAGQDVQDGDVLLDWPNGGAPFALYDFGDIEDWPYTGAIQFNEKTTKDDCKQGGWSDLGFKNQGKCIQYVNTGKDSR